MTKTITSIKTPKEWYSLSDWDSHKPLLYLALNNTDGLVVEMGSGDGSTEHLKKYCVDNNREFISYETNKVWSEKTGSVYVDSYFQELGKIGLLFIDCAPGELRKELIEEYRNDADVIVVHDTEIGANYVYGMSVALDKFEYRLDYEQVAKPRTTAVSNKVNVAQWK